MLVLLAKRSAGLTPVLPLLFDSINKPGGCAKIIKVHCTPDGKYVEGLDVKYLVGGGCEKAIDPAIVSAFETLERGGRKRRSREFLMEREEDARNADQIESIVAVRNCNSNRKTGKTSRKTETSASVSRKPDGGPVIAKETPPSNQSTTSFSTPEKKNKPIPKKVTPIPSLVVTKAIADSVSPMAEDPLLSKDSRKPAARRNLVFGNAAKTDEANVPALPQAEQQEQSPSQRRLRTGDDTAELKPQIAGTHSRTAQAKGFNNQHSAAAVGTMRSNGAGHSLGVARKAACKQAPSFARTKSAYAVAGSNPTLRNPSETPPAAASRQPLLDVYRYEVQKAYEFMDEMVGPRHEDAEGLKENSSFMDTCS